VKLVDIIKNSGDFRLRLKIDESGASLWCDDESAFCFGIFSQVQTQLLRLKRNSLWTDKLLVLGTLGGSAPVFILASDKGTFSYYLGFMFAFISFISLCIFVIGIPFRKNVISFADPSKSFWLRNKDQMIIGIFGAIVGGIITIITTIILFKLGVLK